MKTLRQTFLSLLTFAFCAFSVNTTFAQDPNVRVSNTTAFIGGLTNAMQITHAKDNSGKVYVAERAGVVKSFQTTPNSPVSAPTVFLNMNVPTTVVSTTGEGGLLSIAFHPNFATNGYIYTYYTNTAGDLILDRYTASGGVASTATRLQILSIPHPTNSNHNGGKLNFGPDGMLYLSTGDGGGGNDVPNNAQNVNSLLGKILRINVDVPGPSLPYSIPTGNPYPNSPVYVIGLRNPFRWSFDRSNGDMWIGDVGQGVQEEINHLPAAEIAGANMGWRCFEGTVETPGIDRTGCLVQDSYNGPVYTYPIGPRGRSVIGGVVYRGTAWPLMQGYYIGTDYFSGDLHKIVPNSNISEYQTSTVTGIVDIGEDQAGEIYAVTFGAVYRIVAETALPVSLISFSGAPSIEGVKLNWQTSTEEDFAHFEVEYSEDAQTFATVGNISGANSQSGAQYSFSHVTALKDNMYYRLKMVDTDQSFEYSRIIAVNTQGEQITGAFVRPSLIQNNTMNIVLDRSFETLQLIGQNGQVFWTEDITGRNGNISVPLSQATASGLYIVRLADREQAVQQKVVIVK